MLSAPTVKELVLLGGGHSHVEVLRSWGMRPVAGVRLTLITRDMHTPYSGMLPGYVSGFYSYDDCHIDLCRLATFAKARLIHAEADGIDIKARRVLFPSRPPVAYDVLSIDVGITPAATSVPGASQHTTPVKPIDKFVARFDALLSRVQASPTPLTVAVVGGGAGGVELALALAYRLKQERGGGAAGAGDVVKLFCRGSILPDHPPAAAAALRARCGAAGVLLHEGWGVEAVEGGRLRCSDGQWHCFDEALWCTQAAAAGWIKATGLPTDGAGFLLINDMLQSAGGPPEVFAAGDVASSINHPRPKAGVYAVRQGPPLCDNLRRYLTGQPLQPFVPQSQALALISTGDRYAVGTRGWLTFQGGWAWTWKDHIDRTFMAKYGSNLPFKQMMMNTAQGSSSGNSMAGSSSSSSSNWLWSWGNLGRSGNSSSSSSSDQPQQQLQHLPGAFAAAGAEGAELLAAAAMRCGGCGAKVGSSTLGRVLKRIRAQQQQQQQQQEQQQLSASRTATGGGAELQSLDVLGSDDAAVLRAPPAGHVMVQTVDFFRAFWPDAYQLGAIAANHALGDCYAMGAVPSSALALAVVPFGSAPYQEGELGDLLTGGGGVLAAAGCDLVGGHSSEGSELAAGFTITGHVHPNSIMAKSGLQPGQVLILTKPLGTGTILAAAMQGEARGRWVAGCLATMRDSSAAASVVLQRHGCRAATDVTGFGLLGHLVEMARASKVKVQVSLCSIPALPGAMECITAGILSSLHPSNAKATAAIVDNYSQVARSERFVLLSDPQTAGGLLAGVTADQAAACVEELRAAGYIDACVIGQVLDEISAVDAESYVEQQPLVHIVD